MSDIVEVTGMVISVMPIGEYDRRIVLLTKERGKISAFAKGARRQNSPLLGSTRSFVFGTFELYEGKTSYNLKQAHINNYFEELVTDFDGVCYACYFAELADYYGREGLDAKDMINLLYMSYKALLNNNIPNRLVKCIYELRLIAINGEQPDFFQCGNFYKHIKLGQSTIYTLQYIITSPVNNLFTFTVKDDVLSELENVMKTLCGEVLDREMKSEKMLPQ